MDKHILPSIEQFAAFLDGNLSESEMLQFSQLAEHDNVLHQLLDASSVVDETISNYSDSDLQLPPEIVGSSFSIPTIPTSGISEFGTLGPEPIESLGMVASSACAEGEVSQYSPNGNDDQYGISNPEDGTVNLSPESSGLGTDDEFSSQFPDGM